MSNVQAPDLRFAPGPKRIDEAPRLDETLTSESRIAAIVRRLGGANTDGRALVAYLASLPHASRGTAKIVLVRELGRGRASELSVRAYGAAGRIEPTVGVRAPEPARADSSTENTIHDARARHDDARATMLTHRLLHELRQARPQRNAIRDLLVCEDGHVVRAALARLRRQSPPGSKGTAYDALNRLTAGAARDAASGGETLLDQLHRTFGAAARDIHIELDADRPLGADAEAMTEEGRVYIAPGRFDLDGEEGRVRLGHEVAHVLQQRRGAGVGDELSPSARGGLEAEAEAAGRAFARQQPFAVQGRAPSPVALFRGGPAGGGGGAGSAGVTIIDLKANGGRIQRKPGSSGGKTSGGGNAGSSTRSSAPKERAKLRYGSAESEEVDLTRDAQGEVTGLGRGAKLALKGLQFLDKHDVQLDTSLDPSTHAVTAMLSGRPGAKTLLKIPGFEIDGGVISGGISNGKLQLGADGVTITLPNELGSGSLSLHVGGDDGAVLDADLTITKVPKLKSASMHFHADRQSFRATGTAAVDIAKATGAVTLGLEKRDADKALWSAAGDVMYAGKTMGGQLHVQYDSLGRLTGDGNLDFKISDFLTGKAGVALDEQGHITVNGEIRPPAEVPLFASKEIGPTTFWNMPQVSIPIWGFSIPVVGDVGIVAHINASLGYHVGVGPGVLRNVALSGQYSTDPDVQPAFTLGGELFIPAFAEVALRVTGDVGLDALVASVSGGLGVTGKAGLYGGLSVQALMGYQNGKYVFQGTALMGADAILSASIDAFLKLRVGRWFLSWDKEWHWQLGEWHKNLGLPMSLQADLDYTLGQPLSPDILKFKKPERVDVESLTRSAMPKDGAPASDGGGAHQTQKITQTNAAPPAPALTAKRPTAAPPGAAGGKNQEPRGKHVKEGKPDRGGARPGKGAGDKSKKPASSSAPASAPKKGKEQPHDSTPIEVPFGMNGAAHTLTVRHGKSGGEVIDVSPPRAKLLTKIDKGLGVLGKQEPKPSEQIAALQRLRGLAEKGQKAVAEPIADKDGPKKTAREIAAYGAKYKVKDLDVANDDVEVPRSLVEPKPAKVAKPNDKLAADLGHIKSGTVLHDSGGGDAKAATKKLLEQHKDAKLDHASGQLTLPPVKEGAIAAATTLKQAAEEVARETGVTKVVVTKAGSEIRLDGQINPTVYGLATYAAPAELDALIKEVEAEGARRSPGPDRESLVALCQTLAEKHHATVNFADEEIKPERAAPYTVTKVHFALKADPAKVFDTEIRQISKDTNCPSCGSPIKRKEDGSRGHTVVSKTIWENAITKAFAKLGLTSADFDEWAKEIIGAGTGTGNKAVGEDRQCRDCEEAHLGFSLLQRQAGRAPAGNQFQHTSTAEARHLTDNKIESVIKSIAAILVFDEGANDKNPEGKRGKRKESKTHVRQSPIYIKIIQPGLSGELLELIRKYARTSSDP